MKNLIAFPLGNNEDETLVICEIEETQPLSGVERVARYDEVLYKAKVSFEAAMDNIKPVAETLIGKLKNIAVPPKEIGIEFGIKVSAEAGAIISAISAEANFTVTLKWIRPD